MCQFFIASEFLVITNHIYDENSFNNNFINWQKSLIQTLHKSNGKQNNINY